MTFNISLSRYDSDNLILEAQKKAHMKSLDLCASHSYKMVKINRAKQK